MRQEFVTACVETTIDCIEIRPRREFGPGRKTTTSRSIDRLMNEARLELARARMGLMGARWAVADMGYERDAILRES